MGRGEDGRFESFVAGGSLALGVAWLYAGRFWAPAYVIGAFWLAASALGLRMLSGVRRVRFAALGVVTFLVLAAPVDLAPPLRLTGGADGGRREAPPVAGLRW